MTSFSNIGAKPATLSPKQQAVQPKLKVNTPGDRYEREADSMADRVMQTSTTSLIGRSVNENAEQKNVVMRKVENDSHRSDGILASQLSNQKGSGQGLPEDVRSSMEGSFNHDFSSVRIHTDQSAVEMSSDVNAKAFTYGNDIYFNESRFSPETGEGKRLLAHELTHVVQQTMPGAGQGVIYRSIDDWTADNSPDVLQTSYTQLINDADEIDQWLSSQLAGSVKSDRLANALFIIRKEIERRGKAIDPNIRSKKKSKSKPRVGESVMVMPRVLAETSSFNYASSEERNLEIDRIVAWLQRDDISKADRRILQVELMNLSPQFAQDRMKLAEKRQNDAVNAALTPTKVSSDGESQVLETASRMDAIQLSDKPGLSFIVNGNQIVYLPTTQVEQMKAQMSKHLDKAYYQVSSLIDGTISEWNDWYKLNYEEHPVVGFFVSLVADDDAMDLQARFTPALESSKSLLRQYNKLKTSGKGTILEKSQRIVRAAAMADLGKWIYDKGVNKSLQAAGNIITGLEITKTLGLLAGACLTAGLAAPAVGGFVGVGGLGLTGVSAFAATSVGTGLAVGSVTAVQAGAPAFLGEGLAGGNLDDMKSAAKSEGWKGFKLGATIGTGAGATRIIGQALKLGTEGLSVSQNLWRGGVAGGGGNFVSGVTGGLLDIADNDKLPPGQRKGVGDALMNGLWSIPGGFAGGALGAGSQLINNPFLKQTTLTLGGMGIGAADVAIRGGSRDEILFGAAQGLTTSFATSNSKTDLALRRWGMEKGRLTLRSAQSFTLGAGIAMNNALGRYKFGGSGNIRPVAALIETLGKPTTGSETHDNIPSLSQEPSAGSSVSNEDAATASSTAGTSVSNEDAATATSTAGTGQAEVVTQSDVAPTVSTQNQASPQALLNVRVVTDSENLVNQATLTVAQAIRNGDRAYLDNLLRNARGTSPRTNYLFLRDASGNLKPSHRFFGQAVELQVRRDLLADPFLSQHVLRGETLRRTTPTGENKIGFTDFILEAGSTRLYIDVTTPRAVGAHSERFYGENLLQITYTYPF